MSRYANQWEIEYGDGVVTLTFTHQLCDGQEKLESITMPTLLAFEMATTLVEDCQNPNLNPTPLSSSETTEETSASQSTPSPASPAASAGPTLPSPLEPDPTPTDP